MRPNVIGGYFLKRLTFLNGLAAAVVNLRLLVAVTLCSAGAYLATLSFAGMAPTGWSIVTSPNTSSTETNLLDAVTCTSASDCWAAGHYITDEGMQQTLIQHWNGTSWSIVPSPNTGATQHNVLKSVTCASTSDCWAVGYHDSGGVAQTLIERWNGISWSIIASPNKGTLANQLESVTCASAADCWAVGAYVYATGDPVFKPTAFGTLIERWDGTSWSIVPSPDAKVPGCFPFPPSSCTPLDNLLRDVTCPSATECWAVGSGGISALIERWDGASWQIADAPDNGESTFSLQSVTCTSAMDCWAIGVQYEPGSNDEFPQTLILRWNGTGWSIVPSPNPSEASFLVDIACASPSECWAVGGYGQDSKTLTLIEKWDGNSWAVFSSADVAGKNQNLLSGVTCTSEVDCWAVGLTSGSDGIQTLIERYARATVAAGQLLNISTRAQVQQADNVLIGGFIITGADQKKVLLRAIGPSLGSAGVQGALQNPTLDLFQDNTLVTSNNDWKQSQRAEIEATGIPPANDAESAIVRTLAAGNYTAIVRGVNNQAGIALVEAYDLDQAANSQLGNISTRAFVQTDEKVLIGGVIVGPAGGTNGRVLVRAMGPSLSGSDVSAPLQDPTLELFDGNGLPVATNDNWKEMQQADIAATGIPPSDDRESAIVQSLTAGNYTAIVRGKDRTTGVALVEVYKLP